MSLESAESAVIHGLLIKPVWEDESLFEIEVHAGNGVFGGMARCYTSRDEIRALSALINGFPKHRTDKTSFATNVGDSFSYFGLAFRCVNERGGVIVRVKVANITRISNEPHTDDVVEFDLEVEPAAIDAFSSELAALADEEIGKAAAFLRGKI